MMCSTQTLVPSDPPNKDCRFVGFFVWLLLFHRRVGRLIGPTASGRSCAPYPLSSPMSPRLTSWAVWRPEKYLPLKPLASMLTR